MRIRNFIKVGVWMASVALGWAATASASPVIFGTSNDGFGPHLFSIAVDGTAYNQFYNPGFGGFFDSLIFENPTSLVYTWEDGSQNGFLSRVNTNGTGNTLIASGLIDPKDLVLEAAGANCASAVGCVLVSEAGSGNLTRIRLDNGAKTVLANFAGTQGDGPHGVAYDSAGNLYVNIGQRNGINSQVARIDPGTGAILNTSGPLNSLDGLTFDIFNNQLYATSVGGKFVYDFTSASTNLTNFTTLFSGGSIPANLGPDGLTFDDVGNIYIAGYASAPDGQLLKCPIAGSCSSIKGIEGIDDLAPFLQANPTLFDTPTPTPEPASFVLFGTGLLALVRRRRSRGTGRG